jgi:hypothetical protein
MLSVQSNSVESISKDIELPEMLEDPSEGLSLAFSKCMGSEAMDYLESQPNVRFARPKRGLIHEQPIEDKLNLDYLGGPTMDIIMRMPESAENPDPSTRIIFARMENSQPSYDLPIREEPFKRLVAINYMYLEDYIGMQGKRFGVVRTINKELIPEAFLHRKPPTKENTEDGRQFLSTMANLICKIDKDTGVVLSFERVIYKEGLRYQENLTRNIKMYERYKRYFELHGNGNVVIMPPTEVVEELERRQEKESRRV